MSDKYRGEQGDEHGGDLYWPGYAGLPVRGQGLELLRQEEIEDRAKLEHDFHNATYNLADPDQNAKYKEVMDRIVNGWYRLIYRTDPTSLPDGRVPVYLEWMQSYVNVSNSRVVRDARVTG